MNRFIHYLLLIILPIGIATIAIISTRKIWETATFESDYIVLKKDEYLYDSDEINKKFSISIITISSIVASIDIIYIIILTLLYGSIVNASSTIYTLLYLFPLGSFLLSTASFLLGLGLKSVVCILGSCNSVKMFDTNEVTYDINNWDSYELFINGKLKSTMGAGFIMMAVCSGTSLIFLIINSLSLLKFFKYLYNEKDKDVESNINNIESKPKIEKQYPKITTNVNNNNETNKNVEELVTVKKLQDDLNHAINILQNIQVQMPALIEQQQQKNHNIYQTQQLINLLLQQQIQQIIDPQLNNLQQSQQNKQTLQIQQKLNEQHNEQQSNQQKQLLQLQQQIEQIKQQNNNILSTLPHKSVNAIPASGTTPQGPPFSKEPEVSYNTDDKESLSIPETLKEEKEKEKENKSINALKLESEQLKNNEELNEEKLTIEIKKED